MAKTNLCVFEGNLTRDPELRHTKNGNPVVNFSLAVNGKPFKKSDGTWDEDVSFIDFEAWAEGAELIASRFRKGDRIYVESLVRTQKWTTKEGEPRRKLVFRVKEFQSCYIRKREGEGEDTGADNDTVAVTTNVGEESNGEIPF